MIRLAATTEKLQAVLGGAVSSTQPQAIVCYSDQTSSGYSGGVQRTALNSTTDVDILAAPAASTVRDVDYLSIYNRDSASVTVTVKYDVSATDSIIITVTLATLETLVYTHANGWSVLTATGAIKAGSLVVAGSSGDVQYNGGSGVLGAESAFNYNSTTNVLSVDNLDLGTDGTILFDEHASAPSTPASGNVIVYGKQDGRIYGKDDAGAEFDMFSADHPCEGRLTLTSGTPVTTSDVTAATTIYFTPYKGDRIALYDGSSWTTLQFSETSIAVPASTSQMYDLWAYNNSGTLALEALAWTNDTTRATALTKQNGVYVKTGATTRRYLGSFRTTGVSGQTEDSAAKRYVWNYYNRVARSMANATETANTWNYTTATFRQANANTANQLDFVVGVVEDAVSAKVLASCFNSGGAITVSVGIGIDSTTTNSAQIMAPASTDNIAVRLLFAEYFGYPGLGRHFLPWLEYSSASGTTTWNGDGGIPSFVQSGMAGSLMG